MYRCGYFRSRSLYKQATQTWESGAATVLPALFVAPIFLLRYWSATEYQLQPTRAEEIPSQNLMGI